MMYKKGNSRFILPQKGRVHLNERLTSDWWRNIISKCIWNVYQMGCHYIVGIKMESTQFWTHHWVHIIWDANGMFEKNSGYFK